MSVLASGIVALVTLVTPGGAADAFELFSYPNDAGALRLCKGNTTSGEAVCTDAARRTARVKGTKAPAKGQPTPGHAVWLRYDNPFPGAERAEGLYAFFAYHNDAGKVRVCVGHTGTGEAICRDGTPFAGRGPVSGEGVFALGKDVEVNWFSYFAFPRARGEAKTEAPRPGTWAFSAYRNQDGKARVCQIERASGAALCADASARWAKTRGAAPPKWRIAPTTQVTYLRY